MNFKLCWENNIENMVVDPPPHPLSTINTTLTNEWEQPNVPICITALYLEEKKKYQVLCKLHFAVHIVSLCHVCGLRLIKILFCSVLFFNIWFLWNISYRVLATIGCLFIWFIKYNNFPVWTCNKISIALCNIFLLMSSKMEHSIRICSFSTLSYWQNTWQHVANCTSCNVFLLMSWKKGHSIRIWSSFSTLSN